MKTSHLQFFSVCIKLRPLDLPITLIKPSSHFKESNCLITPVLIKMDSLNEPKILKIGGFNQKFTYLRSNLNNTSKMFVQIEQILALIDHFNQK